MNFEAKKLKKILNLIFMVVILFIVLKEIKIVLKDFKVESFMRYADKLSIFNIGIIILLGIISFIPLTFYDFVLKKRANIDMPNKELYKFSWIASSIASIAGFGGSTAIVLKTHLYEGKTKDKKILTKEISKIVALNLTGFSTVCLIYILIENINIQLNNISNVLIVLSGLYLPGLLLYFMYSYIKSKADEQKCQSIKDAFKIMGISILEWVTTIILIYSIVLILGENISILKFFPIFIIAITVGVISMSPGGAGTFDLTLIVGLNQIGVPTEKVLLVILLYRISYYIIPLAIGLYLYYKEVLNRKDEQLVYILETIVSKISHKILIALVMLSGVILLLPSVLPIEINYSNEGLNEELFRIMPSIGTIILGFLLITISRTLVYKSKQIYSLAFKLLMLGTVVATIKGVGYRQFGFLAFVWILFAMSKKQFYKKGHIIRWRFVIFDALILGTLLFIYLNIAYMNLTNKYSSINLTNEAYMYNKEYAMALMVYSIVAFILSVCILLFLYSRNKYNEFPKVKLEDCRSTVEDIISKYGGCSTTHYVFLNDKYVYINEDKDIMIQYQIYANKIVVLGNPSGDESKRFEAIEEFCEIADIYGYVVVFCAVDKTLIPCLHSNGYHLMKLGEEANVNLTEFTLEGRKMKSVRNAISRVEKENYTFEIIKPPFSKEIMEELNSISTNWLGGRKEKGFSIGFFNEDYLQLDEIAIVRNENNEIKGFANIMPMYNNGETLSIDLMRFSKDTCNGIMDFMFVNLFKYGKENGYSKFNMGMVPLANVGTSKFSFLNEKIAEQIYLRGQNFYSFQGLKKFKEKYCEIWDDRYLAYRKDTALISTMIQIVLLISKEVEVD